MSLNKEKKTNDELNNLKDWTILPTTKFNFYAKLWDKKKLSFNIGKEIISPLSSVMNCVTYIVESSWCSV